MYAFLLTKMRTKQRLEARRAQLTEAFVLLTAVAWGTWIASGYYHEKSESVMPTKDAPDALLTLLPRLLQALNAVAIASVVWTLFAPLALPKHMKELSRQERDDGLVVGCILPPLVLLSRLLVVAFEKDSIFPAATLLYAWTATTAGASLLLKITLFSSCGVLPTLAMDCVFVPLIGGYLGVESDLRFVLPTIGRIFIATAFRFGRLGLRRSFTVGEALIGAEVVGLGVFDLILVTLTKINDESSWLLSFPDRFASAWHLHISPHAQREPYVLALQVGVVGALLICVALTPLLVAYGSSSPHAVAPPLPALASAQFIVVVLTVVVGVIYPWSCLLLDTWNPLLWLISFLLEDPARWLLVVYWLVCLVVFVPLFAIVSRVFSLRQIIARKLFHLLVVVMFVPAFFRSPEMLSLSYGVAFAAFCLVECVRAVSLPPFGQAIATFVKPFIDHREGGRVILTHTYLLLGCALPLWLAPSVSPTHSTLVANAGVLALGVGDAMGAAVGSTFGRRKLFGHKTLEGTAAVLVSTTLASLALHSIHQEVLGRGAITQLSLLLLGTTLTSLLEAATSQIDNLVLSLFLFAVANFVACHR